jgi:hypothetical protein
MDLLLMCKNYTVMNISTQEVYNHKLLPGLLNKFQSKSIFMEWFNKRYSERSNTASRQLRGILFGQGNRDIIDRTTHALSLSDCYWIKTDNESISFEDISPYYNNFWTGEGKYTGEAIPTLYLNGFLTKYWIDNNTLIKISGEREIYCSQLAKALGISTVDIYKYSEGIAVRNFTSDAVMFESAETSGKINPETFTNDDILNIFGINGFDMIFFDALVGNGDRHAGNFGFLRNTDTGEYLGMAPLFDFDHAYDSNNNDDIMIKELNEIKNGFWKERFNELMAEVDKISFLNEYTANRLLSF